MNAEILKDESFGGFIGDGMEKSVPVRRGRLKNAVCTFFCAFSILTYGTAIFVFAEKITSAEYLSSAISTVLMEDEVTSVLQDNEITVKVERSPIADSSDENESVIENDNSDTYAIVNADLSCDNVLALANQTDYDPDMEKLAAKAASAVIDSGNNKEEPLVLVIHTHGTEAYTPEGEDTYTDDTEFRSSDRNENMIAVGKKVCDAIEAAGIGTIHCTEMFDEESYVDSYKKSAAAVKNYLELYPSIRYVLDVHRDAIFKQNMSLVAPVTEDGAAQVMLVCGTDEMGADFPDWQKNLSFALAVQTAAEASYPGFMRNINLRGASFNQQMAERFLLVEVGSAGNTLAQACKAGYRFGEVFAKVIGD